MMEICIEITIGKKSNKANISLPEFWDEVPPSVYPELCSIYLKKPEEMSVYDKTVRAFVLLTLPHYEVVKMLDEVELYDQLKYLDWVFNKLDLQQNLIQSVKIDEVDYFGPSRGMDNLRFAEWCVADTHFINYPKSGDIADLHQLAACLYRPAGAGPDFSAESPSYRGDIREKFNDQLLAKRAVKMAKLSKATLEGIYIFFASCKHQIIGLYPEFFPPNKNAQAEPAAASQDFSWFDIYDDLRGDPKFGGPDKLEDEFLHTVLASIERSNKTMKELKRKHKI